jgi:VCBS repeat-containing protein
MVGLTMALAPVTAGGVAADGLAADDAYSVAEDTTLSVAADTGLLANDTGGSLVLCVASSDTSGVVGDITVNGDGSFEYTPSQNFNGVTAFTYTVATLAAGICPATSEGSATVTIPVTPVNDAPTAANDSFAALADRTLNVAAPGVLGNDSDLDGDPLTAALVSAPSHGSLTLAANGGFSYSPNAGYTGPDAFSYRASDGGLQSGIRVVSLTVTALPPPPTPTPIPTATPEPTVSPVPSPSESPLPSDSGFPTPSPVGTTLATASPSPTPATGPVADAGGPPILAIGALALLLGLLVIAGVYFVRSQRAGDEEAYETGAYGNVPGDEIDDFADDEPEA